MSVSESPSQSAQEYTFISLGANLPSASGKPGETLQWAIAQLQNLSTGPLLISSCYESAPVDCPPGTPAFLNMVAGLRPLRGETPLGLLFKLQQIEEAAGRTRSGIVNEARALDLDLLTFLDAEINTSELTLPHPRCTKRRFVLDPLMEVAGDIILPGDSVSIGSHLDALGDQPLKKLYRIIDS